MDRPNIPQHTAELPVENNKVKTRQSVTNRVQVAINTLKWRQVHSNDEFFEITLSPNRHSAPVKISVQQIPGGETKGWGTATMVWDASISLVRWLEMIVQDKDGHFSYSPSETQNAVTSRGPLPEILRPDDFQVADSFSFSFSIDETSRFIELGAGQGFLGICSAVLGCGHFLSTDLPLVDQFVKDNISRNSHLISDSSVTHSSSTMPVSFLPFDWASTTLPDGIVPGYNLILVCECIYHNVPHHLVLNALLLLTRGYGRDDSTRDPASVARASPDCPILIVYEHRNTFVFSDFMHAAMEFFDIFQLPPEQQHPFYYTFDIYYFCARLKQEHRPSG
ncbi:hypothetical protein BLNAU_13717 [Blattamonas nauphoetae]|uniref:Uncharacterized protein n=1 Tax=Blattamonas nauphoetae TaxID=2049346 RepID=A0ABQ9XFU0_9EUKA|nr:hypothetical protein BLNAU_13717 [Blattamonas nauphoetae]